MLGTSILLTCLISISSVCFYCSSEPCYKENIYVPDNTSCTDFFYCQKDSEDVMQQRPRNCEETTPGYHFSEFHGKCVEPDLALCSDELRVLTCEYDGQLLKHPNNCARYFVCHNMRPDVRDCPSNHHFDIEANDCIRPEEALCDERFKTLICSIWDNPMRPTLLPHPTNCNAFFKCFNGRPIAMICPNYLHFSVNLNRCEFPYIARCPNQTSF